MVKTRRNQKKQRGGGFFDLFTSKPEPTGAPSAEENTKPTVDEVPAKTPEQLVLEKQQLAFQEKQAELKRKFAEQRLLEPAQDNNAQSAYITKSKMLSDELKAQLEQEKQKRQLTIMGGNRKSKRKARKSRKSRKSIKKSKNNKR